MPDSMAYSPCRVQKESEDHASQWNWEAGSELLSWTKNRHEGTKLIQAKFNYRSY